MEFAFQAVIYVAAGDIPLRNPFPTTAYWMRGVGYESGTLAFFLALFI